MFLFDATILDDLPYGKGKFNDIEISVLGSDSKLTSQKTKRWMIKPGEITHATLDISMVGATKAFLALPFEVRQCIGPNERRLDFFKSYS